MAFFDIIKRFGNSLCPVRNSRSVTNERHTVNPAGLMLIKQFEGYSSTSYLDQARIWTCGYGHTDKVGPMSHCNPILAEKWLLEDLELSQNVVANSVSIPLNSNQFSAMVSFCFNIGAGHFRQSKVLELLNAGKAPEAGLELLNYDKVSGIPNKGIERRREAEKMLFEGNFVGA